MRKKRGGEVVATPQVGVYTAGVSIKSGKYESRRTEKQPSRITPKWKVILGAVAIVVAMALVTFLVVRAIQSMTPEDNRGATEVNPTVEIIDESNAGISPRTKLFVWRLEQEAGDYGLKISRVVLPRGLVREVDIYFDNREEKFKMQLDRSPAVMMEDANRIIKYLDGERIKAEYVDVRVEGRGYFK